MLPVHGDRFAAPPVRCAHARRSVCGASRSRRCVAASLRRCFVSLVDRTDPRLVHACAGPPGLRSRRPPNLQKPRAPPHSNSSLFLLRSRIARIVVRSTGLDLQDLRARPEVRNDIQALNRAVLCGDVAGVRHLLSLGAPLLGHVRQRDGALHMAGGRTRHRTLVASQRASFRITSCPSLVPAPSRDSRAAVVRWIV